MNADRRHRPLPAFVAALPLAALLLAGTAVAQDTTQESEAPAEAATDTTADTAAEAPAESEAESAAETGGEAEAEATETAETEAAPVVAVDDVVATVNGQPITLGAMISLRSDLPQQYQQLPDEILTRGLIEQLIDQSLLAAAALKAGLDIRPDVQYALENQGRAVLAEAYMREELAKRLSEERLRAAYAERYADAPPVEEVRAAHILVETEELAASIREELDGGAAFADLAKEHGTDGTAERGGDLGYFVKEDMVPEFAEAAFALQSGEIGGPVRSPFGWHLIQLNDRREKPVPAFEEVAQQLAGELQQEAQRAIVADLRGTAEVSVAEPGPPPSAIRADGLLRPDTAAE